MTLLFVTLPLAAALTGIVFALLTLTFLYTSNRMLGNWASAKSIKTVSACVGMFPAWYLSGCIMGLENGFRFTFIHIFIAFVAALLLGIIASRIGDFAVSEQINQQTEKPHAG